MRWPASRKSFQSCHLLEPSHKDPSEAGVVSAIARTLAADSAKKPTIYPGMQLPLRSRLA